MDEYLKPSALMKIPIVDGDIVCIVHDRDYHPKFFSDAKYRDACRKIGTLNSESEVQYQLIITYPKFEFWMLMHSDKIDPTSLNFKKLKQYPDASKYVDDLVEKTLDVWKKGSKKRIEPHKFDSILSPNIRLAISNSENPKFVCDVEKLCTEPGTSMGKLMKELLPPD